MTKATVIKLRLSLCHTTNTHWLPILHMVMYMFPRYSSHLPHPFLPLLHLQCFWATEATGVDSLLVAPFPSSSYEWATCILLFLDMAVIQTTAYCLEGFPGGSEVKASASNVGDQDLIPGSGRSPGEGNGTPLQYSCLENPMDGGAW